MPKVTVHAGLTFAMGAVGSNQYGRVDVTVADIDTDASLEEQLAASTNAAAKAFAVVADEVSRQAGQVHGTKK